MFRLCVIGNLLGRNPGYITTQGQITADLFRLDGWQVVCASSKINPILRLIDVVWTILNNKKAVDILILEVYSGRSFILADATSLVSKLFNITTIFVLHGGNLPEFTSRYSNWVRRVFMRADVIVAPSTFLAEYFENLSFSVRVIPNVVSTDDRDSRHERALTPNLLWMRSFHEIYNPQMALDALSQIKRDYPDTTLVMAGADKGLESEIKESARQMGLLDSVRFPGFLDKSKKTKEFAGASVYLNTNRIDNMPVSVIEACSMGVPVISTDVGGILHLLTDGENGLLVKDGDAAEMARAIKSLFENPGLAERLSENGRLLAGRSTWPSVRKHWIELFAELLESDHPRHVS